MENETYENFPLHIVLLSNLFSLATYGIGAYISFKLGAAFAVAYLVYCLFLEVRLLRKSCINCYYYGKLCALGKGKLAAILFKKGEPESFSNTQINWVDLLPDMLVMIFPLIAGIILLFKGFSWLIFILLITLVFLSTAGNDFIRGSLACKHCKQRELGCPAERFFSGNTR